MRLPTDAGGNNVYDVIVQASDGHGGIDTQAIAVSVRNVVEAAADFNGDGTSDVILQSGGTVVDWIEKNGLYSTGNLLTTGATGFTVVGSGDFNGDGSADALLQNGRDCRRLIIKNGQYQTEMSSTTAATGFTVVGTGDFNAADETARRAAAERRHGCRLDHEERPVSVRQRSDHRGNRLHRGWYR